MGNPQLRSALLCLVGAAALFAAGAPARAQQTLNLTAVDGYPPKSSWVRDFIHYFIPEVDKRLAQQGKYKIAWNQAWSGQITKVRYVLEGLQKGLGDIGIVTSVFHADKVPLQNISYVVPFVSADPRVMTRIMDDLAAKFPAFKDAWAPYNQVYLTNGCVLDSYQLFTKQPVKALDDLRGMKIAGAGENLRYIHGLGAAGVSTSLVENYNKLQTGVVNGAMLWAESVVQFKLVEVAPHMLQADIGAACSKTITMNADAWKKLPAEVRDVIAAVAIGYRDVMASNAVKEGQEALDDFRKAGGKIVELPRAQREAWAKSMPNLAEEWVGRLEPKGIPARQILAAYMDAMRAANQPIVRHWDRE